MTSAGARESIQLRMTAAGCWPLAAAFCVRDVVARQPVAPAKALVALLHERDNLIRRHFVSLCFCQRDAIGQARS